MVLVWLVACASSARPMAVPLTANQAAPPVPVEPGLAPPEPTLRLPRNFLPTSYAVRLAIDPARSGFEGAIAITGEVSVRSSTIWLHGRHLKIARAVARRDGRELAIAVTLHGDDLLELRPARPLEPGAWTLAIDYAGEYELSATAGAFKQVVRGDAYVYTQFESIYARRAFPCFDEPDSKVPWQVTLDVPAKLIAVSNTPVAHEEPLGPDTKRIEFAPTRPLPSYLVAFGVGPFDVVDAGMTKTGTPVRVIALKDRAPEAAWAAKTAPRILELLEDMFASHYPYDKLDLLAIPMTVGFGAMENAGLVTFAETLILLDPAQASKRKEYYWVRTAAHELAHQWFGDLVTTAWWDDIWLNEGFATWAEHKIAAAFEPAWHEELFAASSRGWALAADALSSARQIRQPIVTPDDIFTAFDGITYNKGAAVLDMFESHVGHDVFLRGLRDYLKQHAFSNATSSDFTAAIGHAAGKDVSAAFGTFLDQAGAPEITATLVCDGGKPPRLALSQQRYVPPGASTPSAGKPWLVPVCAAYDRGGQRGEVCTMLDAPSGSLALDTSSCPRWVIPNVDGRGYYHSRYSAAQVAALRDIGWSQLRPTERSALAFDMASATGDGKLPLELGLSLVPRLLAAGDQFSVRWALWFPLMVRSDVPDELLGTYEAWLRRTFGAAARKAGLSPRDGDSLDTELARLGLVDTVANVGRDPELTARAVQLAERWRELPQGMRGEVIALAAPASPAVFARLLDEIYTEPDRTRRQEIANALSTTRDVTQQRAALALMLDPRLDIRDVEGMLFGANVETSRVTAQQFFQANQGALMKRLPSESSTGGSAWLAYVFTASCSAKRRDEIARYVTDTFAGLPGGPRTVRQAIEGMDQCIARRALLVPELRRWLAGKAVGLAGRTGR